LEIFGQNFFAID